MSAHRASRAAGPGRHGRRVLAAVMLLTAVPIGVVVAAPREPVPAPRPPAEAPRAPAAAREVAVPARSYAARVLHRWDRARAAAYADADADMLARLYTAESVAGARDVALLASYDERGLAITGLRVQVFALSVLRRDRGRLVLAVTDRVATATAIGDGGRWRLPADDFTSRVLIFRRVGGRWLLSEVRPRSGP